MRNFSIERIDYISSLYLFCVLCDELFEKWELYFLYENCMFLFVIYEEIFNIIEFIDNLDGSFLMSGFDMMCYSLMVFLVEIDIDIGEIIEIFFVYFDFDVDYDFDF